MNAALEIAAEVERKHIGGNCQLTARIQTIVNTALEREREACALACSDSGSVHWAWVDAETACAERIRKRSNVEVRGRPHETGKE